MGAIRGVFVTGTDTGVGKTVVAASIAAHMKAQGLTVGVMKPAETGCSMRKGELFPKDAAFLRKASGTDDILGAVCPYRFDEPLAPAIAAQRAGKKVDTRLIVKIFKAIARQSDFTIVEGAGGLMVPLCGKYTFLDLAAELGLPLVIVGRAGLGTINHTVLTVEAARARGVAISGIILNHSTGNGVGAASETNPKAIEALTGIKPFVTPYTPGAKSGNKALAKIGESLSEQRFFTLDNEKAAGYDVPNS
jgi:dethiobiotin synthetase